MTGLNNYSLSDFVEELNQLGLPVLVEGINDKKALVRVGVIVPIFTLNREPLYKVAERLSCFKKIVFLFDHDKTGRLLSRKMSVELSRHGVKIIKRFQTILGRRLYYTHVEGIRF